MPICLNFAESFDFNTFFMGCVCFVTQINYLSPLWRALLVSFYDQIHSSYADTFLPT